MLIKLLSRSLTTQLKHVLVVGFIMIAYKYLLNAKQKSSHLNFKLGGACKGACFLC